MKVIIAPHADDEIIGTFEILKNSDQKVIIYNSEMSAERKERALKLPQYVKDIKAQFFLNSIPPTFLNKENTLYFPDPIYETHPLHRFYGSQGEAFARSGLDVIFYTTNMQAPYIHEVKGFEEKEKLLNQVYPDQKSLWEYEKKYFLFEGYCKWIF